MSSGVRIAFGVYVYRDYYAVAAKTYVVSRNRADEGEGISTL